MVHQFFSLKNSQYFVPELRQLESTPQLKTLIPKLDELFIKASDLKNEVKEDASSISYKKCRALLETMSEVQKVINTYKFTFADNPKKTALTIDFVAKLKKIIDNYLEKNEDIFNKPRNNNKQNANYYIKHAALTGGLILGFSTGSILLGFIGVFGIAPLVSTSLSHALSLDDKRTATAKLLEETSEILENIQDALEFDIDLMTNNNFMESFPLECPITKSRIKYPVFCTLDQRIYEKKAIEEWFSEHRTAPCNGQALEENQLPSDVLKDIISLRETIQALEEEYKTFKLISIAQVEEKKEECTSLKFN